MAAAYQDVPPLTIDQVTMSSKIPFAITNKNKTCCPVETSVKEKGAVSYPKNINYRNR